MNNELLKTVVYFAGCLTAIAVAFSWIVKGVKAMNRPQEEQNKTIKDNCDKIKEHEERLSVQEEQSKLLMQGMLALLSHSIDGNNIEQMKSTKNDIQKFLIEK